MLLSFSLIIPTFNEEKQGFLARNLREHSRFPDTEIICIDGGSTDRTVKLVEDSSARLHVIKPSNRAQRLNQGFQHARGLWSIFVHPRTFLPREALLDLLEPAHKNLKWGAWTHGFDHSHPLLKFTSWYSNRVRGDRRSIFYLDHCLFVKTDLGRSLGTDLFPPIPIFEDTEACLRLQNLGRGVRLSTLVTTSSVRFQERGILRQALMNQWAKIKYLNGTRLETINRIYEGPRPLNGELE